MPDSPHESMTNSDLQNKVMDLLESGCTVLAETERFVHQVRRRYRLQRMESGAAAWDSPAIFTLNRWMETFWTQTWPDEWPASAFARWRILKECLDRAGAPEPLTADFELVRLLDESFEQCLRYGIDPGFGEASNRLVEWRREVWRLLSAELSSAGLFHPAQLPQKICLALDRNPYPPSEMAFVGFEFAGHWEKQLPGALNRSGSARFLPLPNGTSQPRALVFTDPGQEISGLVENLLAPSQGALHETAIVALDSGPSSPALADTLQDLLGEPLSGGRAAYNLAPDQNLAGRPLFCAALLPLHFAAGGEMREDLFALLRSPYYGAFARRSRRLARCDLLWRKHRVEAGMERLLRAVREVSGEIFPEGGSEIGAALSPLLRAGRKSASFWISHLRRIWEQFEFPVLAGELDQMSRQGMDDLLSRLERDFGAVELGVSEFAEILKSGASRVQSQKTGLEDAGIQVIGWLDARGLSFAKIFVPGLVSGVLPRTARPLPLLSPAERKKILGGTAESQFAFARHLYGNFLASAPEVILSRPAMSREGEACLPSPFWPQEIEEKIDPLIPWKDAMPAMQRAGWVRQSIDGASGEAGFSFADPRRDDFRIEPLPFADPVSVSALKDALVCPARFFFAHILDLEEIPGIEAGISPLERGQVVHDILAEFVWRAAETMSRPPAPETVPAAAGFEELLALLEQVVAEKLGSRLADTLWQVERERLIGGPQYRGLLPRWLEEECKRLAEGWSWIKVESSFPGMELEGCSVGIRGRLDRIDLHPELGVICWDYKTGNVPGKKELLEERKQPQLPAYLLAVGKGLIEGAGQRSASRGAGYIDLSSPGKVKHLLIFPPGPENETFLRDWEREVSAVLTGIAGGDICALWLQKNRACEEQCAYRTICGSP